MNRSAQARPGGTALGYLVLLLCWCHPGAAEGSNEDPGNHDCGVAALYYLLQWEGRPTPMGRIEALFPPPARGGYSLAEIRDAARGCGLPLVAVKFRWAGSMAPDRPAIVFLRRGRIGHFAVVRPVGHTGTLVQIIDNVHEPEVMDAARLSTAPEWTGVGLAPTRPNWPGRFLIGFGLAVSLAAVVRSRCVRDMLRSTWTRLRPSPAPLASGGQG